MCLVPAGSLPPCTSPKAAALASRQQRGPAWSRPLPQSLPCFRGSRGGRAGCHPQPAGLGDCAFRARGCPLPCGVALTPLSHRVVAPRLCHAVAGWDGVVGTRPGGFCAWRGCAELCAAASRPGSSPQAPQGSLRHRLRAGGAQGGRGGDPERFPAPSGAGLPSELWPDRRNPAPEVFLG